MMYVDWAMCNALVEEFLVWGHHEEKRKPSFFLYVFKVHVLWDSKYEGGNGKKKIPVFVSKFGEIVFFFLISLWFFFSPFIAFFKKKHICRMWEGRRNNAEYISLWKLVLSWRINYTQALLYLNAKQILGERALFYFSFSVLQRGEGF